MTKSSQDLELTEEEWVQCSSLDRMLRYLNGKVSERKFRLTECAFVRRFWNLLHDERSRRAIEVEERFADGLATEEELRVACAHAETAFTEICQACFPGGTPMRSFLGGAMSAAQHSAFSMWDFPKRPDGSGNMWNLVWIATAAYPIGEGVAESDGFAAIDAENANQALLLHEIFGNPFQLIQVDESLLHFNNEIVSKLVQAIYDERRFDRMPELADVLLAAGCKNEEILAHCRGPKPHVPGCWVLDLMLGKR